MEPKKRCIWGYLFCLGYARIFAESKPMVRIIRCYICHGYHHADVACHYCDARRLANGKYYNHYGIELVRGFHFNIPRLVSYPSPGAVTIACARIVRRANGTSALPASA